MRAPIFTLLIAALAGFANAADWPQFRGPNQDGSSPEKGLPEKFSKTEGVKWSAPMPGPAASVPAVFGDNVFVSSSDPANKKLLAICLDAKNGSVKWSKSVADGYQHDTSSNLASPSPSTDGERAYFYYGTGLLAAYDFSGKEVWTRDLMKDYGRFGTQWTYSSSAVLDGGKLYVQVLQRNHPFQFQTMEKGDPNGKNESYILALDPKTGKEIWRHVRASDAAEESLEAFSSPSFTTHAGKRIMLISGGDTLTGHDAESGAELWRLASWNPSKISHWRLVPSPVAGDGVALVCAPKNNPVFAASLDSKGDVKPLWESNPKEATSDVSTPAFYEGKFYVLDSGRKTLACVEPKTGKVIWQGELPSKAKIEASPSAADGKIYATNFWGEVFVVKAGGDKFELLNVADFGNDSKATRGDSVVRSGIAIANGNLFIRVQDRLYCVGK